MKYGDAVGGTVLTRFTACLGFNHNSVKERPLYSHFPVVSVLPRDCDAYLYLTNIIHSS